ncbi:unnamed protein product, partial [Ectocarpus sp. 4 AP-2014]
VFSRRSRLVLVWQSTTEADFHGTDDITALQEKSNGLLGVTALISEGGRARKNPRSAFRKAAGMARSVFSAASPAPSNTSSFTPFTPAGSAFDGSFGKHPPHMTPS